jgi:hypothetical protein
MMCIHHSKKKHQQKHVSKNISSRHIFHSPTYLRHQHDTFTTSRTGVLLVNTGICVPNAATTDKVQATRAKRSNTIVTIDVIVRLWGEDSHT